MGEATGYTVHKGFRIYLPEEQDYRRDRKGRYVIHVQMRRQYSTYMKHIEIPDCFGKTLEEAQLLSIEMGMRLVNDKNHPWIKRVKKKFRRH